MGWWSDLTGGLGRALDALVGPVTGRRPAPERPREEPRREAPPPGSEGPRETPPARPARGPRIELPPSPGPLAEVRVLGAAETLPGTPLNSGWTLHGDAATVLARLADGATKPGLERLVLGATIDLPGLGVSGLVVPDAVVAGGAGALLDWLREALSELLGREVSFREAARARGTVNVSNYDSTRYKRAKR